LYDITDCPLCKKQYIRETTITEYNDNGEYSYDVKDGNWCLPKDMCSVQQKDNVLEDGMSLRELCIRLMQLFDLTTHLRQIKVNIHINRAPYVKKSVPNYLTPIDFKNSFFTI
jgi:hypothetical protein